MVDWLFTDVVFAAMGNEKANAHWEAELPRNYDRGQIENFIRAKYGLIRKWVLCKVVLFDKCPKFSCSGF